MLIAVITGTTSRTDIQVQRSFSHFLVRKTGTTTAIGNEKITAVIKGRGTENVICQSQKIKDIALISQFTKGYLLQQVDGSGNVENAFLLALTTGPALQIVDQDYVSVSLDGLQSSATYEIYGFEVLEQSRTFLKYQNEVISGSESQQKTYTLGDNSLMVAIRNNGALSKIRLFGYNGNEVTYTPEELKALARELNGMTIGPDYLLEGDSVNQAISGGATDFFYLPTTIYRGMEITTVGGTDCIFIKVNNFGY